MVLRMRENAPHINDHSLVLIGPSGVGKGTVVEHLVGSMDPEEDIAGEMHPVLVSWTTRGPRPEEEHDVHYHFTDEARFSAAEAADLFIETDGHFGALYGTPHPEGRKGFFAEIDYKGASRILGRFAADELDIEQLAIVMIVPEDMGQLAMRLFNREDDVAPEKKLERLRRFKVELEWGLDTPECVFITNPSTSDFDQRGIVAAQGVWAVMANREHEVVLTPRQKPMKGSSLLTGFDTDLDRVARAFMPRESF